MTQVLMCKFYIITNMISLSLGHLFILPSTYCQHIVNVFNNFYQKSIYQEYSKIVPQLLILFHHSTKASKIHNFLIAHKILLQFGLINCMIHFIKIGVHSHQDLDQITHRSYNLRLELNFNIKMQTYVCNHITSYL